MGTELFVSVMINGETHTTRNSVKEALLMRVQQLDRLLEWAETISNTVSGDDSIVADMLMKMSKKSNAAGYRLLGSECVSLATSDELADFCETRQWPETVQRLLDTVKVRRGVCLAAALKIEG